MPGSSLQSGGAPAPCHGTAGPSQQPLGSLQLCALAADSPCAAPALLPRSGLPAGPGGGSLVGRVGRKVAASTVINHYSAFLTGIVGLLIGAVLGHHALSPSAVRPHYVAGPGAPGQAADYAAAAGHRFSGAGAGAGGLAGGGPPSGTAPWRHFLSFKKHQAGRESGSEAPWVSAQQQQKQQQQHQQQQQLRMVMVMMGGKDRTC
jgi:hypothetical protein